MFGALITPLTTVGNHSYRFSGEFHFSFLLKSDFGAEPDTVDPIVFHLRYPGYQCLPQP